MLHLDFTSYRFYAPLFLQNGVMIHNKSTNIELDGVTRDPKYWITELELFRYDLQTFGVNIDDVEIMTHIMSNLPE